MDTEKCKALLQILSCGSLSAAAERMGYTPSGLSRMVSSMEDDIGFTLLQRRRDGVRATKECEQLIPIYREFIAIDEKYRQSASEILGIQTGTVVVGTAYSIYYKQISEIIASFKEQYPDIEVIITNGKSTELYKMILDQEMDFGIVSRREGNVSWHHMFDDPLVAVVPVGSAIAGLKRFPLRAFETESYIETFRGQDTDNARMFKKNNIHPNIAFETADTYASHRMVEAGLGVSLSNYIEAKERTDGKSVCLMELDEPQMVQIGIATPSEEYISPAAKRFRDFAIAHIKPY